MSVPSVPGHRIWSVAADVPHGTLEQALSRERRLILSQEVNVVSVLTSIDQAKRYAIHTEAGTVVGLVVEEDHGFLDALSRFWWRGGRPFRMRVLSDDAVFLTVDRPWFWFVARVVVSDGLGVEIGRIEQRWTFFRREFDLYGRGGEIVSRIVGPFFHPWTFSVWHRDQPIEIARIEKQWTGLGRELFTNASTFVLGLPDGNDGVLARLLLGAALLIDFCYFEPDSRQMNLAGTTWPTSGIMNPSASWSDSDGRGDSGPNSGGGGANGDSV